MPNKDRPLVDRHPPKNGEGWLMSTHEQKVCRFRNDMCIYCLFSCRLLNQFTQLTCKTGSDFYHPNDSWGLEGPFLVVRDLLFGPWRSGLKLIARKFARKCLVDGERHSVSLGLVCCPQAASIPRKPGCCCCWHQLQVGMLWPWQH